MAFFHLTLVSVRIFFGQGKRRVKGP